MHVSCKMYDYIMYNAVRNKVVPTSMITLMFKLLTFISNEYRTMYMYIVVVLEMYTVAILYDST